MFHTLRTWVSRWLPRVVALQFRLFRVRLRDVNLHVGGSTVLEDVTLEVEPNAIFGLVGPNGAGKTSLFNCISGHYKPTSGSIMIDGQEVLGLAPSRLAAHGLARTFQHPALQLTATVLQNVLCRPFSRGSRQFHRNNQATP